MFGDKTVTICVPAYNVKEQIGSVLQTLPGFVDHIIVVDDACPEKSGKVAAKIDDKRIHVIYNVKNRGVGGAVTKGYKKALALETDIAIKMDGDGQMDPGYLEQLILPIIKGEADYAKGNRFIHFNDLKKMPKRRLFGNSILSFLAKLCSGYWSIMDPTNGFTALSTQTLRKLNLDKLAKRYFYETDMLINLNILRAVVVDVPMPAYYSDEKSSLRIYKILTEFPIKMIRGLIKRIFLRYYIYDFNMASVYLFIGLPMLIWGICFGAYRWWIAITYNIVNTTGTVMLSVLPLILGTQLLLQAINIDISNVPKR